MAFATCRLFLVEEPLNEPQELGRPDAFDQSLIGAGGPGCLLLRHRFDEDDAPRRRPSRFDGADSNGAVVLRPLDAEQHQGRIVRHGYCTRSSVGLAYDLEAAQGVQGSS
jgi:hypothetical protein